MKLAFTVGTTSGNQARELSEQIIQEQLKKIGVKLTIKNSPDILDTKHGRLRLPDDHLRLGRLARPVQQQRDLAVGGDPGSSARRGWPRPTSATTRAQNYTKIKDPHVDELLNATDTGARPGRAGRALQPGRPAARAQRRHRVPLFQKPTQLGYRNTITGVQDNPTAGRLHLEHRGLDLHAARPRCTARAA